MKVRIDVLKAPWPEGAKVGDVVEMEAITPAFVGKCTPVADDMLTAAEAEAKAEEEAKVAAEAEAEAAAIKAEEITKAKAKK